MSCETDATGQPSSDGGSRRPGGDEGHLGAERGERPDVRIVRPGCGGCRRRCHPQTREPLGPGPFDRHTRSVREVLADRVAVEQRLGRVLVVPVAGVDHRWRRRICATWCGAPAHG